MEPELDAMHTSWKYWLGHELRIMIVLLPILFLGAVACPDVEFLVLSSETPGVLVCNRTSCPNITCVGRRALWGDTCFEWQCLPDLEVRIPPPYEKIHVLPLNPVDVLFTMLALMLMCACSPAFFIGVWPADDHDYYS